MCVIICHHRSVFLNQFLKNMKTHVCVCHIPADTRAHRRQISSLFVWHWKMFHFTNGKSLQDCENLSNSSAKTNCHWNQCSISPLAGEKKGLEVPPSHIKHPFLHHCSMYSSQSPFTPRFLLSVPPGELGKELAAGAGCSALGGRLWFQPQGLGSLDKVGTLCFFSASSSSHPPSLEMLPSPAPPLCPNALQMPQENQTSKIKPKIARCTPTALS